MDPATMAVVATIISGAIHSGFESRKSTLRARQQKREMKADLLNSFLQRQAEVAEHGLQTSKKIGSGKAKGLLDTAATMREIFR